MIKDEKSGKLDPLWLGPYKVIEMDQKGSNAVDELSKKEANGPNKYVKDVLVYYFRRWKEMRLRWLLITDTLMGWWDFITQTEK